MSVSVEIDIADGMARRNLEINRVADGDRPGDPHTYEVILRSVSPRGRDFAPIVRGRAEFEHAYIDDVLTLIAEAITALRENGVERA